MPEFTVVTYNIRHGLGMDNTVDLKRIIHILSTINPSIILLQEVDMGRPRSFLQKQAKIIAKALEMNYVYGIVKRFGVGSYGNAVLFSYPVLKHHNYQLHSSKEPRCCLDLVLNINEKPTHVLNTHLGLNHNDRMNQVSYILSIISSITTPVILGGDFNCKPESKELKILLQNMKDSFECNFTPPWATYPSVNPQARIDFTLYNSLCHCRNCHIVKSDASDHLPLVSRLYI